MSTPQKTNALQSYQMLLYDRALHPELFSLKARRVVRHGPWELEAWVMQGQHLLRFECGAVCASELVTDQEAGLPTAGALSAFLCAGERDFEHRFGSANGGSANGFPANGGSRPAVVGGAVGGGNGAGGVVYMTTVQTETLSENLYAATCEEMAGHIKENDSLVHAWEGEMGAGMSIVDVQRYAKEVHAQAYHLLPSGGIVIRTQTIFEHA
ncbi:MAG: DUF2617 family protein [Phycisphaerales bacterium]|nr:DUF2617 family protein [Phycisphaerales bacterium]